MTRWQQLRAGWRDLGKDIVLTGTGIYVIVTQVLSSHPSGLLLGTGLALTVPSTWGHIQALLGPSGDESSSPPSVPPGSSHSSSSRGSSPPELLPGSSPLSLPPGGSGE